MNSPSTHPGKSAALLAILALLSSAPSFADQKPLTEVRSPNFRVLTDGSDRQARRIAREFEEMRGVFAVAFPKMRLSTGAPLLIFAMQDERSMISLAPAIWHDKGPKPAGLFQHGWEKQFAIVRLDQDIPGAYQVVYHEYVHSLLHTNFRWLPTWLDEGLAEFYGNTRFESKKSYVGAPSRRVNFLKGRTLIPLETLLTVSPYSYFRGKQDQIDEFYAESWALVHFLMFSPGMEQGNKLAQFYNQLQRGEKQLKAFQESFGGLKEVENRLQTYIQAFVFSSWMMDSPGGIEEKDFSVRKLSKAESDAEIAGYRLWEHDAAEATGLVEDVLKADPNLALAHEEKGFIFFHRGKDEDALQEFFRAYDLDKQRYLSQYFKTMIVAKKDTPAHRNDLQAGLMETVKINPQFAPAFVQLAMLELYQGHDIRALSMARKAEQLEPSRAGYHLLCGEILLRLNKGKEAAELAKFVAERWTGPDHNEAVALWNEVPPADRPADTTLTEEVGEQSQTAEGTLVSVKCEEKMRIVTLQRGDERLEFHSKGRQLIGYSDTLWYGTDHFNFCQRMEGMHAVVRYRPPVGNEYAGDWMSIELRDELPAAHSEKLPKDSPAKDSPAQKDQSH